MIEAEFCEIPACIAARQKARDAHEAERPARERRALLEAAREVLDAFRFTADFEHKAAVFPEKGDTPLARLRDIVTKVGKGIPLD